MGRLHRQSPHGNQNPYQPIRHL